MAVTPARVNQIAQSWQFQQCKWAGPVEAWHRFKRNIFRIPAFSLRFFDVHVVAPAVSKRISKVCLLVSARVAVACCWLRYISRGPSFGQLWCSSGLARRERRLRLFWAFGRLSYISRGPSLGRLVIEWIFARRERRLRQFWACVQLSYFSRGPSFWPSLVIE